MENPVLKKGSTLRVDIERLQLALIDLGYTVDLDAFYGPGLQKAVCQLQESEGLKVDGVVGLETWGILANRSVHACPPHIDCTLLENFRGDLHWLHQWEGHAGRPYWPGGASGVTLDPGLDLGHASPDLIEEVCGSTLTAAEMKAVRSVLGKRGDEARRALDAEATLARLRILRTTASKFLPHVAQPYWQGLCRRFDSLASPSTPGAVQTALLSLGYNRGAANRGLQSLSSPLAREDWLAVADLIGDMQQDHKLEGIRRRRRGEADLIRSALSEMF